MSEKKKKNEGEKGYNDISDEDIEYAIAHSDSVKNKLEKIDKEADKALEVSEKDLREMINS